MQDLCLATIYCTAHQHDSLTRSSSLNGLLVFEPEGRMMECMVWFKSTAHEWHLDRHWFNQVARDSIREGLQRCAWTSLHYWRRWLWLLLLWLIALFSCSTNQDGRNVYSLIKQEDCDNHNVGVVQKQNITVVTAIWCQRQQEFYSFLKMLTARYLHVVVLVRFL